MKKKILAVLTVLAIIFSFSITAFAAEPRLRDDANLLSASEKEEISGALDELSEDLGVDITIHTTESFDGKNAQVYSDDFYDQNGYGDDGVLFVLNMQDREAYISTAGEGIQAFTDYGIEQCFNALSPYLSEGDVAGAFQGFISTARRYFQEERNGNPVDTYIYDPEPVREPKQIGFTDYLIRIVIGFAVAFLISLAITASMKKQMKSVVAQQNANVYVKGGNINITGSSDRYLYHHVTVVPIPQNNNRSGGGGRPGGSSVHISSSGRSHGGGGFKF